MAQKTLAVKGIYKIENLINGKVYIGQSVDIYDRLRSHKNRLCNGTHINKHLQNSWNKYGECNFDFSIIERCGLKKLTEREQYWIDFYGGLNTNMIYNKRDARSIGKLSEEHKRKIGESNRGKIHSEEWKKKHGEAIRGRPAWNKGLTIEDSRVKKYVRKKGTFKHTQKTKQLISDKLRGKRKNNLINPKQRLINMSNTAKNRIRSEEEIERLRTIAVGRIWINDGDKSKMIYEKDFDVYKVLGYRLGRGKVCYESNK